MYRRGYLPEILFQVLLLHWNVDEATERLERLRAAGFEAGRVSLEMPGAFRQLRENPPNAIVIDLSRLPSQGRDVGLSLRTYKDLRQVPIVFVDGDPKKVSRIKRLLPDAFYTSWDSIGLSLRRAIANPPSKPLVPKSRLEATPVLHCQRSWASKRARLSALSMLRQVFRRLLASCQRVLRSRRGHTRRLMWRSGSSILAKTWKPESDTWHPWPLEVRSGSPGPRRHPVRVQTCHL